MRPALFLALFVSVISASVRGAEDSPGDWKTTTWNGERAFAASSGQWKAIVSVERARLVYFGADAGDHNLLFVPSTRSDPAGWGGHRLWLGPQTTWSNGWPPPAAWEKSAAERVAVNRSRLELTMPDAHDGWPRLTRVYFWADGRLHCDARASGGTRTAQIIHILQVPALAEVRVHAAPKPDAPRGYVQVHLGRHPSPRKIFPTPPHVTESAAGELTLKFADRMEKLGFTPQPLVARIGANNLTIDRGASHGAVDSTPDDGYVTQVYLGSGQSPLIELEQLSTLYVAGGEANFEIVIEAREK